MSDARRRARRDEPTTISMRRGLPAVLTVLLALRRDVAWAGSNPPACYLTPHARPYVLFVVVFPQDLPAPPHIIPPSAGARSMSLSTTSSFSLSTSIAASRTHASARDTSTTTNHNPFPTTTHR